MKIHLRTLLQSSVALVLLSVTSGTLAHAAQNAAKAKVGEIVVYLPGMSSAAVDVLAAQVGCEVIKPIAYCPDFYVFGVKGRTSQADPVVPSTELLNKIDSLKLQPGVSAAAPNWIMTATGLGSQKTNAAKTRATQPAGATFTPNDSLYSNQKWHMEMIRMPEAWNIQLGTSTVKVAVIDSGIDATHPDFISPLTGRTKVIASADFVDGKPGVDEVGHGTHVAGTIAATTNNATGVVGVAGLNRNGLDVRLIDAKGLGVAGGDDSSIASAIGFSIDQGAAVINMSLGNQFPTASPGVAELAAIQRALRLGIVVVASAGNGDSNGVGINNDLPGIGHWPSDIPGVIKVTAVNTEKKLTTYSNYGGSSTIIASPGGDGSGLVHSTVPVSQGSYGGNAGTSMASPHVAGVAALLVAAGAPSRDVYTAMANTAQAPGETLVAAKHGPGIVDAYSALYQYADPAPTITLSGAQDRGNSYFGATPIQIGIRGVKKIVSSTAAVSPQVSETNVTVQIQTLGRVPSVIYTFTGGRNVKGQPGRFEIPTLSSTQSAATQFTGIQVPTPADGASYAPPVLSPGQYKIVARVRTVSSTGSYTDQESVQFINIIQKQLASGRTMFAMPFRSGLFLKTTASDATLTSEAAVLGTTSSFSIAHFNPLRLPSESDYARFRSTDSSSLKSSARFDIADQPSSVVNVYDTTAPTASISPIGMGYWLDVDQAIAVDTTRLPYPGQLAGVSPIADNAVGIKTYASGGGWNMIGAPFTYPVDWSVVTILADGTSYSLAEAVNAKIISPALVGFASGDYVFSIAPAGQLEPFNAYWVRVYKDCTVVVPPVPSAVISRGRQALPKTDGWKVRLIASVGGDRDGQNYIGQSSSSTDGIDMLDIQKPPAGAGHAYVRLESVADGASRALAFDLRSLGSRSQEWTSVVSADRANADVVLSWEGVRSAPHGTRLLLKDLTTGAVIPMANRSSYIYRSGEAGSSRSFKIVLEPAPSTGGLVLRNLQTVTTRAASGWAVKFTANQEAEVQGTIRTMSGRTINVLSGASRAQGGLETTLRWDGRNADGSAVPPGPYTIVIVARSADGTSQTIQRPIQVLR